ncbi:hypothetical protein M9Y10_010543 [Tritrichomonas musculus]|uniref:PPPDE domain-containing protein n=1 Tax=Tritrichomonas musculus TaxID=1915356 RepID=A0ABR2IML8_9EUKA
MISIILSLCTLNYIPKEFDILKRKAIKSSLLKPLSDIKPEPIISPSKPYIYDSFIGTVLHPIFGYSVKELKGFAISKNREHLAIIVDRKCEEGLSILQEESIFFTDNGLSFSLTKKFADDGEVAIFNISEIDPLSAFDNFDFSLSSLNGECSLNFGNQLGARCGAQSKLNWNDDTNTPAQINYDSTSVPDIIKDNLKFYGGINTDAQASVIVKRRGASIQAECDATLDVLTGVGFHINSLNSSGYIPNGEFLIGEPFEKSLGEGKVHPFGIEIKINASIYTKVKAKDVFFIIPHDIDIMRMLTIHLKKHFVISSKHVQTSDFEKIIKLNEINTEAYDDSIGQIQKIAQGEFKGLFLVSTGIRIGLYANKESKFIAETGPKTDFDLTLGFDREKCTFPGLYGAFTPKVSSICDFSGSLGFAGLKFISIKKPLINEIYSKEVYNGCFFDGSSSSELELKLLEGLERKRSIIQIVNAEVKNLSLLYNEYYQPVFFFGETEDYYSSIKYISIDLKETTISKFNDYVIIPEDQNFSSFHLYLIQSDEIQLENPFNEKKIDLPSISFTVIRNESQPIIMGNQFNIQKLHEFRNFQCKFMPSKTYSQTIGLILHTEKEGYFCDPTKYYIVDEVNDEFADKTYKWIKIFINSVRFNESFGINIYKIILIKNKEYLSPILFQSYEINNETIEPIFNNSFVRIKQEQKPKLNEKLFVMQLFNLDTGEIYGYINVTYEDVINSPFSKNLNNIEITFDAIQNEGDVEYIFQLEDSYIEQIKDVPKLRLKGIIAKTFYLADQDSNPQYFTGTQFQVQSVNMETDELYGTFMFYFKDPGYNLTTNKNVFAFIQLKNAQPLVKSSKIVDEKEELYTIKIELGISVISKDTSYILSIPFRRKTRVAGTVTSTLYCIYQSFEQNNGQDDPFCPDFPEFKLKQIENFYVGCIRTYIDKEDYNTNIWDHYPDDVKVLGINIPGNPPDEEIPFSRLHAMTMTNPNSGQINDSEPITVIAKQQYLTFPLTSRSMIIEDETIQLFKKYAPKDILQIWCPRCSAIYKDSYPNGKKLFSDSSLFIMAINNDTTGGFILESVCNDDDNQQYCIFDYNIKNEGYVLLEFNPQNHQATSDSKKLLADFEGIYPGVEEIYDIQNETPEKSKTRLNINCRRQVVPPRSDTFYLTKPWKGKIKKIATKLEERVIEIELIEIKQKKFIELEMLGLGFQAINSDLSDQQIIPFNPRFITENDQKFKELLAQIGINIKKSRDQTINDGDVVIDNDGIIKVKSELFNEAKLNETIKNGVIDLIDLPPENYILKSTIREIKEKKGKKKKKNVVDKEASPQILGDFDVKVAYVGGSTLELPNFLNNARNFLNYIIPYQSFYHSGIWVGPSNEDDNTLGIILVYGAYFSFGNNPTFLLSDGARAYVMSLGRFKKNFKAYNVKKLIPQRNLTMYQFLDEVKASGKWRAGDYHWFKHNCQHFAVSCLNILQPKRFSADQNDWKVLPRKIMKMIDITEKNFTNIK